MLPSEAKKSMQCSQITSGDGFNMLIMYEIQTHMEQVQIKGPMMTVWMESRVSEDSLEELCFV